jgi:hypothetical protein
MWLMLKRSVVAVACMAAVALVPARLFAWGCSRSFSGSSSYTSPSGHTYSGSSSFSGSYSGYHGGYCGSSYYGYHGCSYGGCGGYGAAFAAGAVTGAVVGATVASAVAAPTTTYVYPTSGVYVAPPPVYVSSPVVVAPSPIAHYPIGSTLTVLPAGFTTLNVNGVEYYQSGPNWYQMRVGGNGVYFVTVPTP